MPFLDHHVRGGIQRAVERAIAELIVERAPDIKRAVADKAGAAIDKMATSVIAAFTKKEWRANLVVSIPENDELSHD